MLTEKQFKERCAEILRSRITFSGQLGDYIIHGALEELWQLHIEQKLHSHDVTGASPDEDFLNEFANKCEQYPNEAKIILWQMCINGND